MTFSLFMLILLPFYKVLFCLCEYYYVFITISFFKEAATEKSEVERERERGDISKG